MQDKTITFVLLHLGFGGIERFAISLAKALRQQGYRVNILCVYKLKKEIAFDRSGISVDYVFPFDLLALKTQRSAKLLFHYPTRQKVISNKMKQLNTDVIITTRVEHNILLRFSNAKNKIATEHSGSIEKNYQNKVIKSCRDADYLVVPSQYLLDAYKSKVSCRCVKIPHFLEKIPTTRTNLSAENLISVSRLSPEKRIDSMLRVIGELRKQKPKIKLHLFGDGPLLGQLIQQVKQTKLTNNILFHGFCDEQTIAKTMQESAFYLCTSQYESFGLAPLEAMAYGIPVATFDSAKGLLDFVNQENGIVIKSEKSTLMAQEIQEFLKNHRQLSRLSTKARQSATRFYLDNVIKQWLSILQ